MLKDINYETFVKKSSTDWYWFYRYASFSIDELDPDKAYDTFKKSYEDATGKSWSKEKFLSRSGAWQFFGDQDGYVTVRVQNSGLYKLTGIAGNPKSILKGLNELNSLNVSVWGMVSGDIADMAERKGYKVIRGIMYYPLILALSKVIPKSIFGADFKVNFDSSLTINYADVGSAKKYLIGNPQYFSWLKSQLFANHNIPSATLSLIKKLL